MFALLIGFALAQKAPQPTLAEKWTAAKIVFNESEVKRMETALKDAGKKSRQTRGDDRQRVLAQINGIKRRLAKAKAGTLPPMIPVGGYVVGMMGYLVDDPDADNPKPARARVILFMDAVPILGQGGFKCTIGGDTLIVEAKTDAQSLQFVELTNPVEVVGTYKDLGGTYYVLRSFTPPAEVAPKPAAKKAAKK